MELFKAAQALGLDPRPTPKAVDVAKCVSCGLCEVGCASGAKWDSRRFLREVTKQGGAVITEAKVEKVVTDGGKAVGVQVRRNGGMEEMRGDVVVLAAGGIGTAQILRSSGIPPSDTLWTDLVLTIGGELQGARQLEEPPMIWYSQRKGYIISPYLDILSHWFHKPWRNVPIGDRVGMMIKLADTSNGRVMEDGSVEKKLTQHDKDKLSEASREVTEVMIRAGVREPFVQGLLHGGHLGGTVPLDKGDVPSMHPSILPENLWVADLSLLPRSQGLPTMLTSAALALRVARQITDDRKSS